MKSKTMLSVFIAVLGFLEGCQPAVDKPAIDSCFMSKIDQSDIEPVANSTGTIVGVDVTATSWVFQYDKTNKPITALTYVDSQLSEYTRVSYKSDGTLDKGTTYDSDDQVTGKVVYTYNNNKQLTEADSYDSNGNFTEAKIIQYNTDGLAQYIWVITADYTSYVFDGYIYRHEYDQNKNVTKRYYKFLERAVTTDPNFVNTYITDLQKQKEYLDLSVEDYDGQFNPFTSQATLAAFYQDLPSVNNGRKISRYFNNGQKYLDITYSFQYNKRGFPYIYTQHFDYSTTLNQYGYEDYTSTASYEYNCK